MLVNRPHAEPTLGPVGLEEEAEPRISATESGSRAGDIADIGVIPAS